ncbi:MAG: amidohydrolase family protein [Gammaproteobacteria bacterium]|nr:amidohydrolase family protein [Gammaproteobacteria bacterium]
MTLKHLITGLVIATVAFKLTANDMVPGKQANTTTLIKNATVHTVSQGVLTQTDVLITKSTISKIGKNLPSPEGAEIIDATGKHLYPGLIALTTTLGLVEIGAVRATRDAQEVGRATPEVKAHVAYNADSEIIPTVRSNGITYVEIAPTGNGITGQGSVMQLDSWNWQDGLVKAGVSMHMQWPNTGINKSFWEQRSPTKQKEDNDKAQKQLEELFEKIKAYAKARKSDSNTAIDVRWEAMRPIIDGLTPLFIHANDYRQIVQAINFGNQHKIKIVLVGARDAAMALDLIKSTQTPIIFTAPWGQPARSDDGYNVAYTTPSLLETNQIPYALAIEGDWNVRDLPFAAGQSVAHGTSKAMALRSVTLEPARILGLEQQLGSIEENKQATLILSKGDIFDHLSHSVEWMMINGRIVDLNNRHKQLYEKYSNK